MSREESKVSCPIERRVVAARNRGYRSGIAGDKQKSATENCLLALVLLKIPGSGARRISLLLTGLDV